MKQKPLRNDSKACASTMLTNKTNKFSVMEEQHIAKQEHGLKGQVPKFWMLGFKFWLY